MLDSRSRPLRDLRISVTDRCNLRCTYCMPQEIFGRDYAFLPRAELLTFEEITRLARAFASEGVSKVRLTGGEPLLRRELEQLIAMLANVDGITDIALTHHRLRARRQGADAHGQPRRARRRHLRGDEGRQRPGRPSARRDRRRRVLRADAGQGQYGRQTRHQRPRNHSDGRAFPQQRPILRFIEYMDVGVTNGWRMDDVVPAAEIIDAIQQRWPLQPIEPNC